MADYTLLKNPRALSTVEQLQISMFVYICACRYFNSNISNKARGFFIQVDEPLKPALLSVHKI